MEFGSDDEKALTKAIDHSFPGAKRVLCTKHLKDNLQHYMTNVASIKPDQRSTISNLIFGDQGLVNANDSFEFERISSEIVSTTDSEQFKNYFSVCFKDRVGKYVTEPRRAEKDSGKLWTNNNSETMNHVLKMAVDWKPKATPELVDKIYDVVNLQFLDMKRVLYGNGNYRIAPKFSAYVIPKLTWRQKSNEQKRMLFKNFLKDSKNFTHREQNLR